LNLNWALQIQWNIRCVYGKAKRYIAIQFWGMSKYGRINTVLKINWNMLTSANNGTSCCRGEIVKKTLESATAVATPRCTAVSESAELTKAEECMFVH
jgi:hypothetical protein